MTTATAPILLIGARGGLGRAVAEKLIAADRPLIAAVRDAAQAQALREEMPGLMDVLALDLTDGDGVLAELGERFGSTALSGVIVCAAECRYGPLEIGSLETARRLMEVNAISCLAVYMACMPALRRTGGTLILVSSNSGVVSLPFVGQYQASKFALEAYADVMRMEARKWGVRVVLVEPGGMETPMKHGIGAGLERDADNLSPAQDELYGDLYRGFRAIVRASSGASPVAMVADKIIALLGHDDPEPRYPVGDDTAFLIAKRKELSDREMDDFALALFGLER